MSYKKPKPNRSIAFPFWILWRLVSGHSEAAWGYHLLSESLSETRTPQLKDRRGDRHPDQGGERERKRRKIEDRGTKTEHQQSCQEMHKQTHKAKRGRTKKGQKWSSPGGLMDR